MAVYVNTSGQARTWLRLTNPDTGRTLHLEAGEEVELDVPDGFSDPHLQPKSGAAKKRASRSRAPRKRAEKPAPVPDHDPTPDPHTEGEE